MNANLPPVLPRSLQVVAVLFMLGGLAAVIEVFMSLGRGKVSFNFNVLGIFIGKGLFELREGWRVGGLFLIWIGLASRALALMFLSHSGPHNFYLFGQKIGYVSTGMVVVMVGCIFIYSLWQHRVLTRRDVRILFLK